MARLSFLISTLLLLGCSLVASKDAALPNAAPKHPAIKLSDGISRRAPYPALPPRKLAGRAASPDPQTDSCWSCLRVNGDPGCVPEGSSCCEDTGYCGPGLECCYGKCLRPSTEQCCDTPGVFCDDSYECYKDRDTFYPMCCTDAYCQNQDSINVVVGYTVPTRPKTTTTTRRITTTPRAVWSTYSSTVYWTYYYYYYLYIEVRRTTTLTSERTVTTTVLYVTATDYSDAYDELSESEDAITRYSTVDQPTTTFRGPTPPATIDDGPSQTPNDVDTDFPFPTSTDIPPPSFSLGGLSRSEMLSGVAGMMMFLGVLAVSIIALVL